MKKISISALALFSRTSLPLDTSRNLNLGSLLKLKEFDLANRTSCYGAGPNNDDRSALSLGEITVPGGSVSEPSSSALALRRLGFGLRQRREGASGFQANGCF
ncbi:MAG: hypothetical protein ACJAT3_001250 [Akkermansiaceae bacterium]|jgi:hypothetical protein